MRIVIPKRLPSWNLFWSGMNHRERTRIKNDWKIMTLAALGPEFEMFTEPVVIEVTTYTARNPLDPSNLCVKVVEDPLIDRVLMDDGYEYVDEVRLKSRKCNTEKEERTEIVIRVAEWKEKSGL
jgi:hypothetical protein